MTTRKSGKTPDGQPLSLAINAKRRAERDVTELLGLVKAMLIDGEISEQEARFLAEWIAAHPDASRAWPCEPIVKRLHRIFEDGRVDDDERRDLAELLASLVGGDAGMIVGSDASTALPLDIPQPAVTFTGSVFVLTGKFAMGPRAACESLISKAGGRCESDVTKRTRYLVIGTFGSRDWIQTSYGRKIEQAVEYRSAGQPLSIVDEDHWANSLPTD